MHVALGHFRKIVVYDVRHAVDIDTAGGDIGRDQHRSATFAERKECAFACVLSMRRDGRNVEEISELAGLAKTDLRFASILAILMFSLAGIPPLAGFWAKWYAFLPAIKAGLFPLAIIGVVASVVGAFYYLRIVKVLFFDEAVAPFERVESKALFVMAVAAVVMVGFVLPFIGGTLVDAATAAAASLVPPAP